MTPRRRRERERGKGVEREKAHSPTIGGTFAGPVRKMNRRASRRRLKPKREKSRRARPASASDAPHHRPLLRARPPHIVGYSRCTQRRAAAVRVRMFDSDRVSSRARRSPPSSVRLSRSLPSSDAEGRCSASRARGSDGSSSRARPRAARDPSHRPGRRPARERPGGEESQQTLRPDERDGPHRLSAHVHAVTDTPSRVKDQEQQCRPTVGAANANDAYVGRRFAPLFPIRASARRAGSTSAYTTNRDERDSKKERERERRQREVTERERSSSRGRWRT